MHPGPGDGSGLEWLLKFRGRQGTSVVQLPGVSLRDASSWDELPRSKYSKKALSKPPLSPNPPGHHRALPMFESLGELFYLLNFKGLLRMQRRFLLLFPSHSITAGHQQMEAAFYMQIFGTINSPVPAASLPLVRP